MKSFLKSFVWHMLWPIRIISLILFGTFATIVMVFFLSDEQMNEIEFGVEYVKE